MRSIPPPCGSGAASPLSRLCAAQVRLLAALLDVQPPPDPDAMSWQEAERFIGEHWRQWMER